MNKNIINFISSKNFKTIIHCIEFLYLIGFSLEESYKISHKLFGSKINIKTEGLTDEELFFVECLNGCEIKIVKERYPYSIFYIKNGEVWFEQNLKNEWFWCSYIKIWSVFEIQYQWNYQQIQVFIKNMLEKHLELGDITLFTKEGWHFSKLEKHLELGDITLHYSIFYNAHRLERHLGFIEAN